MVALSLAVQELMEKGRRIPAEGSRMPYNVLSLDGEWDLTGTDPSGANRPYRIKGRVPGHVQADLIRSGLRPDPFWRDQAAQCAWVNNWNWRYSRAFHLPSSFEPQLDLLQFDGIDGHAEVLLNGEVLGAASNAFAPYWFEVGPLLRGGRNTIEVLINGGARRMAALDHAMPALSGPAIWQGVRLARCSGARADGLYVNTIACDEREARIELGFNIDKRTNGRVTAQVDVFDAALQPRMRRVFEVSSGNQVIRGTLDRPELWWPNGMGGQPLYYCRVILMTDDGAECYRTATHFGIRAITVGSIREAGQHVSLYLNGQRVFLKAAGWVPPGPFPGVVGHDRYERLIGLAAEAHVNCLYASNQGIYEPEVFWETCDRRGMLVIQDFPLTSPLRGAHLEREYAAAVQRLKKHPSLCLWNISTGDDSDALDCLRVNDRARPQMPFISRDSRLLLDPAAPPEGDASPVTSFAVPSTPSLRSMLRFISPSDAVEPGSPVWASRMEHWQDIGGEALFYALGAAAEAAYGMADDPQARLRHMEYLQYRLIRRTIEQWRRQRDAASGVALWRLNDIVPACGCSLVDYYGFGKAGYYAMKRGFQPVIVALEPRDRDVRVWIVNDTGEPVQAVLTSRFQPWSSEPAWRRDSRFELPPQSAYPVAEVPRSEIAGNGMLVCDLECPLNTDRALFYPGAPKDMALPSALIHVEHANEGTHGAVTLSCHCYARVVTLDAVLDFEDNYFDLLPGEERTVRWHSPEAPFSGAVPVSCWNGSSDQ